MATRMVELKEWYSRQEPTAKWLLVLGAGGVAVAAGVVVAPALGLAVSTAGLGVAGGTLSGAAASSAGLAVLGGGSLAAGGFGMAGGTAVVATVTGAAGVGVATCVSRRITREGAHLEEMGRKARGQVVDDDGIRFAEART